MVGKVSSVGERHGQISISEPISGGSSRDFCMENLYRRLQHFRHKNDEVLRWMAMRKEERNQSWVTTGNVETIWFVDKVPVDRFFKSLSLPDLGCINEI